MVTGVGEASGFQFGFTEPKDYIPGLRTEVSGV